MYISATPSDYELEHSNGEVVEQLVRPTGIVEPSIDIRETKNQIDDLMDEIKTRTARKERVLVTTLTKKMAEELTDYYLEYGIKVKYMHSDIDTLERTEIIRGLRKGEFDVLVGINLLREAAGYSRSFISGNFGSRQGRIFAFQKIFNSDNGTCGKKCRRTRYPVC